MGKCCKWGDAANGAPLRISSTWNRAPPRTCGGDGSAARSRAPRRRVSSPHPPTHHPPSPTTTTTTTILLRLPVFAQADEVCHQFLRASAPASVSFRRRSSTSTSSTVWGHRTGTRVWPRLCVCVCVCVSPRPRAWCAWWGDCVCVCVCVCVFHHARVRGVRGGAHRTLSQHVPISFGLSGTCRCAGHRPDVPSMLALTMCLLRLGVPGTCRCATRWCTLTQAIFYRGHVRHLPAPSLWPRLWRCDVPEGTYQNGGYWSVAHPHVLPVLASTAGPSRTPLRTHTTHAKHTFPLLRLSSSLAVLVVGCCLGRAALAVRTVWNTTSTWGLRRPAY